MRSMLLPASIQSVKVITFVSWRKREEMMKSELPKHTSSAIEPIIEETNADFTTCQFDLTWNSSCSDAILFRET